MGAKTTLDAAGLRPRKKWGQHFLVDSHLLAHIADAAEITDADTVLEIGPGLGHLTRVLAARAARLIAVELDAALVAQLRAEFVAAPNVTILQGDVLAAAPHEWIAAGTGTATPCSYKIVANLPYYITSAILRHVLQATHKPSVIVVMVQREVARRILAQPPRMNLLAVSVQFFARPRLIRTIPAGAFYPRPRVDSAIVRLDVHQTPRADIADPTRLFRLVRAGFGERRKQLRNALVDGLGRTPEGIEALLARAHIAPTRRAETLTLDEWVHLYHALT